MKSNSLACTAAVAFLALGLAVAWYGTQKGRQAQGELAGLAERRTALAVGIEQTENKIEADSRERAQLQASQRPKPSAIPAAASASPADPSLALILSHPKLTDAFLAYFRASLSQRFGAFYSMAGLSPDQIAKFEDLVSKHQEEQMDLMATGMAQHLNPADPAIATLRKQQNDQFRAAQVALLGAAGYQQMQQFNRAQVATAIVQGAANLALDSEPYSNAQAGQLTQMVAAASPSYQKGGAVDPTSVDWDSVVAKAGSVLSPSQVDALKAQVGTIQLSGMIHNYFASSKK